jgi:ketosteroid isomerase-like protein
MSEPAIELLKPVYAEWAQGNFRPVTGAYGTGLEWGWSEEFPDIAGVEPATEGRDERLVTWLSSWDHWQVEAEEYLTAGDMVLVMCRYTGRGKGSGVSVDTEGAHLWTIQDGQATRLVVFSDRDRAREAAGLAGG